MAIQDGSTPRNAPAGPAMSGVSGMPMSGAPPILTLQRRWTIRGLIIFLWVFFGLPALVMVPVMILGAFQRPDEVAGALLGAGFIGLAAVGVTALCAWLFLREMRRKVSLYEQGIELIQGSKQTLISWNEVSEIWIFVQRVRAGGLVGMAAGAIADALSKDQGLNERRDQIVLRIKNAAGTQIKITNNDKGVVKAYEEAMARVNPRLVGQALSVVKNGGTAAFGKIVLGPQGVSFNSGKSWTAYTEVNSLAVNNGQVVAKKEGKWLSLGSQAVAMTPNLYVLTAVFAAVSGSTHMDVQGGRNLGSKMYV
jgi:hypothetical protein